MMWLLEYRIDGLRFDSVANIRNVYGNDSDLNHGYDIAEGWCLLQDINNSVTAEYGRRNLLTIAEDLKSNEWITKDTGAGGAGFATQWDNSFMDPLRDVLAKTWDQDRDMFQIRGILYHRFNGDAFQHIVTKETHDAAAELNNKIRLTDAIDRGHVDTSWIVKKRIGLGAAMVMCAAGIPQILQGEEILEWRPFGDDPSRHGVDWNRFCDTDNDCRTCMTNHGKCMTPTGDPCTKTIACSECPDIVERCTPDGDFSGIFMLYRDLIHLRRNWYNNTRGLRGQHINVFHVNNDDKLIAFQRWADGGRGDDVIVVLNFANRSYNNYRIGFPREGHYHVRFNSDSKSYDQSFGDFFSYGTDAVSGSRDGLSFEGNIGIGPYSAIILTQ